MKLKVLSTGAFGAILIFFWFVLNPLGFHVAHNQSQNVRIVAIKIVE